MAWLDERIWCHPKFTELSDRAFRVHVSALAYSSGFNCRGALTAGQQKVIGSTPKLRRELIAARLWEDKGGGSIEIHDWKEHNERRDNRREADRERKRQERLADPNGWIMRTGEWQRTRKAVFERDGGLCVDCGKGHDSWHADHVPDRKTLLENGGDPFDIDGIVTRCPSCHSRRHSIERHRKRQKATESTDTATDRDSDRRALTE